MKEEIERRRAEAAEKKKQKEESKEGSKAPFIAPKGASAKVSGSLTYSIASLTKKQIFWGIWYYSNVFYVMHFTLYLLQFSDRLVRKQNF